MKISKKTKISDLLKNDPKMTVGDLLKTHKSKKKSKKSGDKEELQDDRLNELKEEAFSKEMEGATGLKRITAAARGADKMRDLEQEYKTAKTGIKSRYGGIAKAFGADPKTAAVIDRLFGKKVDDKELAKLREKFNLDEKGKSKKDKKAKKEDKGTEKKEAVQKDLIDKIDKIFDIVKEIRSVVEGVANKLRASPSKEVPKTKKGMRKLEKDAGLKYSKETGRYHDVKTKKMVGFETARQKMNISPSALKVSGVTGAAGLAGVAGAPPAAAPTASKVMEGKADTFAKEGPKPATEEQLNKVGEEVDKVFDFVDEIKGFFSLKKFYGLIGGAIGAVMPFVIKAGKWLWENLISPGVDFGVNIAKQIGQWLGGIEIPEFKILGKSIGPFKPFGFLAGVKPAPTEAPAGAAPAPAAEPTPPPGEGSAPPKLEGGGAPAGGGGGGGGGTAGGGEAASGAAAPAPAPTATPQGSNMAGGSPPSPKKSGGGGGSVPSGGYLGAAAEFIAKEEGLPKGGKAYWDPPGQNNLVSIGYGHQIKPEEYKQGFIQAGNDQVKIVGDRGIDTVLSKDQAKSLLAADLPKYEERAKKPLGEAWTKLDDEQKAALISYAYNTGSTGSLVKQGLKEAALTGNDEAGGEIIAEKGIRTAGGKPFPPLVKRRKLEGALYAEGESSGKPEGGGGGAEGGGGGTAVAAASPTPAAPAATPTSSAAAAGAPTPAPAAVAAATPAPSAPTASPVPPTPSTAPTASPVETPPTYAQAVAANTTDVTAAKEEASSPAPSAPAPTLTAAATPQPSGPKPPNPDNSVRASARLVEDTFTRALAKDFSHPSTFTTVVMV